jgi:cyclic pyranopterin phosphate synthase
VSFCNHRCIFCGIDFARQKPTQLKGEVLGQKLKEMGKWGVRSIMYAGEGEPLLHKDLPVLVRVTQESGIDAALTTNGNPGDYALWEELLPALSWVKFSVDAGSSKVYSDIHQVPEKTFGQTCESIRQAVKVKRDHHLKVTLGVQFLILEENLEDIENALQLFARSGIDYFVLKPYSLHPQMIHKKEVVYQDETIQKIKKMVDAYTEKGGFEIIFRQRAMEKYLQGEKEYRHCYALPFWGYLSARGDFHTCSVFWGDDRFRAGNIYEKSMEEILFGEARKKSIEYGEKDLPIGNDCRLNCRMARINEFLEYLEKRPGHVNFI